MGTKGLTETGIDYNNPLQVGTHILVNGLRALNEVTRARHNAYYERKELLTPLVIMGTWYSDTCGNAMKVRWEGKEPKVKGGFPLAVTMDGWKKFLKDHNLTNRYHSFVLEYSIPPDGMVCDVCGKKWTLETATKAVTSHRMELIPLDDFVGKTLREVEDLIEVRLKGSVLLQPELMIKNKAYEGLKDHPVYPDVQMRDNNEDGWIYKADKDTYRVQNGDQGYFNVWAFRHEACQRSHLEKEERKYFEEVFREAGFKEFTLYTAPNEYCSCLHCAPWFRVRTELGLFKIGWRKRVINLQWGPESELQNNPRLFGNMQYMFKDEDVTLWNNGIHCWGKEKAIEYLKRIREAINTHYTP